MLQPILAIPLLTVLMAQGGLATYPHRGAVQGSASDGNTCYSTRGPLSYNPLRQICCADGVYEGAEANYICKICETTMFAIPKSSRPWRCCGRNNDQPYNPETSHCCFGQVKDGPEDTTSCFRCSADSIMSIPRDESKSYMCCGDQPYNTLRQHCCAGSLNNGPESAYICQSCGDNMMSRRRDLPPLRCCGVNNEISYDPSTHHCCGGFNQPKYGPQRDYVCQRCGNSYFSRPATDGSWRCCKGQPYNPAEQHCCFNGLHSGSEEHFTCQRCGNEVFSRRRDEPEYWCCSHPKMSEMTPYNPQSQTCCNGQIFSGPDNQHSCQVCGSTPFVRPSTDEPWRCCNTVTPYSPQRDHCCFGELRSGSEEQSTCVRCGKNLHTVPVNGQPWGCCGAEAFNPEREVCCNGQVYPGLVCGYEALPAPGTVLGLAAENVDSYSVGLRWYSPSNTQGLFGYRIFYRSASGGQESVVDTRSLGTSYTLSGLQPDSQYIIQVMAYGIAGDGQRSNTLRVQTAPEIGGSTPAQFVQARPRDSDSVDLEWNAPAGITTDRVQGYRILYKQTTETNTAYLDVGRPVSGTSFTLGGLEPHTDYDIVIVTIDDTGASSHSMPVRVRTAEGIPGPPGSLQRTAVGSNRLQVAWEPPASVNGVLEGYRLYYQVRGEDSPRVVELGPESTRYTLTGLESSTQYIVWVSAFTSAGEGLRSGNIAIRTSGGIPGAVRSLRGDPISPTSVRVQWEKPTYNADGVQGYRLYYMQVGGRDIPAITLEGNLQSYIISGLQPNSGYEIWLVAFTSAGDGQESPHITVRTGSQETVYPPSQPQQPQLPGTPRDVRVSTVDPFTILVHWQPPTSGGDISNYLVYYQVADENRAISVQSGPNDRSHLLGGLQPDTQYLIWIVAVSPVGVGLRSPAVPVQTQAVDVLPDAPRGLQVTPIGPTMIRVQWVPPRGGGAVSGYRIYYQVLGQPSLSLEADASERTRIIGQLLPNTEYTVWVLAFNPAGEDGSETQRFTVRTTAAVPGFVPRINVTAIDDTTLWVSWEAPETGAPVRGYRIYYQAMSGDQMPSTVETGPLVQSQAVSGLEPGIEYMIWIVAFSNQGDSEDSPRVRIRTNARVPDRAQPLPEIPPVAGVPGIPQDIQGTSLSSSSIQVQWQEPATDAAPSGYRVYYQVVGEATISFKESRAEQRILIVEDLQPNTDYNIWVTAYSPAGTGQRSARITVRTLQETPQLPGVPDDVRVVDVGQTTIHVQWQRPRAGGDVTGYRIYYQPENQVSASAEVVNPSTLSYIIPGLQPDMEYTVWLVALSSLGMGLRSPLVTVRTEPTEGEADYTPEVPGMPEDVTAYATSAVSIRVEWQTPTQEDRVSGYRIRYQAEGDPAISTIEVDREERSYDIMALTPETDYTVWVVAFSAEGMGLRSPKVHARTPEDGPCDCDYVLDVDADKIKELYADKDEDTAEEVSTAQPGNPASPGAGSDTGDSSAAAGGGGTNEIAVAPVVDAFLDGDNGTSAGVGGGGTGTRVTISDVNTDSLRAGADGNNMDSTDGQNGTGSGVPTTEAAVVDASFNGDNSGMPAVVQGGGTDTDVPGGSSSTGNLWNGAGGNNVDSQDGHNGTGSNASDSSTAGQGAHWEDSGTEAGSNNSLSNGTNSNNGGSISGADGDHGGSMAGADGDHGGSVTGADGDHAGSVTGADGDHGGSMAGADGDHAGSMAGADGDNSGHEDEANGADGGVSGNGHVETSTEASSVSPADQASAEGDNSGSGGHNNVLPSFGGAHADNAQDESMFNGQDGGLTSENATAGKHADRSPEFGLTSHNTSGSASTGQASGSDASTTGADANSLDASWFTSDGGEGQPGGTVSPGLPSTPDSSDRNSSHHNVSTAGKVDSGRPNQVGISAVGNSGADTQPARHGNRGDVSFDEYYGSATSDNSIAPISPDESKDDGVPVEDWSNKTSTEGTDSSSARGNAIASGVPGNPAVTGGEDADVTAEGNPASKEQGGGHGKQDNAMESSQTGGVASKQERQQPATGRDGSPTGNALDGSHAGNVGPSRPAVTRGDTGTRANSSQNSPSVTGAVGNDIDGDMTTGSGEVDEADSNGNNVNSPADHHSSTRPSPNYVPGVGNGHSGDRFIPGTGNSLPGSAVGAGVTFNQTSQQGDTSDFTEAVVGAEGKVITVDGFLDVDHRNTDSWENATSASDAKPDESSQPGLNHGDRHGGHHGDRHGGHHGDRHGGQASNNVSVTEGHPDNPISSGSVADGANSNQTESSPSALPSSPASSGFGGRTRHEGSLGGSATANHDKEGFSGRGGVPSSGNALGGRDAGVVETAAQSDTTEAARNSSHGTDNSVAFVGADGDLLDHEGRPVQGNEVPPLSGSASSDADTTQAGHLASRGDGHAGDGNVPEGTAVSRDGTSGVATVDFNIDIYEPNVPALPGSPASIQARPTDMATVLVEWRQPTTSGRVDGYRIYYQASNNPQVASIDVGPQTLSQSVGGLESGTEYTFWVQAVNAAGLGYRSPVVTAITDAPAPSLPGVPQNVQATALSPMTILVEWEAPSLGGDVQGYMVYHQSREGGTTLREVGPSVNSLILSDLRPETRYSIWVVAHSDAGMGLRSSMKSLQTPAEGPRLPGRPMNVLATAIDAKSILVEWQQPTFGGPLDQYRIYYEKSTDQTTSMVEVGPGTVSYTLMDLLPDTEYSIWVVGLSNVGMGERSPIITVRTLEAPRLPETLSNVRVSPTGPTSITVEWEAPDADDVQGYEIYYQTDNLPATSVEMGPDDRYYTISDLLPGQEYTVWLVALTFTGRRVSSQTFTIRTEQQALPGVPDNVRAFPTGPTSILVQWQLPSTGSDVQGYRIYSQAEHGHVSSVEVGPDTAFYTLTDLMPDTEYTVWVIAFSAAGMGDRSVSLAVRTEEEAPKVPGAPGSVRLTPSDPTSITVEWEAPTTGGDVEGYNVYYQPEDGNTRTAQVEPSDIPSYTIMGLTPNTLYTVWVIAFSSDGLGQRSQMVNVMTEQQAPQTPGVPRNVEASSTGPTTIVVQWASPDTGAEVQGYTIYYQPENEPTMRVQVSPSDIPYTIRDLLPDTQYTIWIVAFSTEGMGERSPALTVSTQEEAPATPGAPGSVRLTPSDPTSITVEWEAPTTGGDVEYYVIYYQAENEPTMRVQVSPSDIPYTIRDLLPDTQYTIWIVAFSTEGMGERSPALTVSTQEEAPNLPGAPGSVRLTPSDPTSITVEWEAPTTGGDVEYYVIYYQTEDEPVLTVQLDQTMRQYTIEDLLPDTPYTVWIVAFSAEGEGERSSVYYVQTAAEAEIPGAPGNVQVTPFNATALTVEWEAPTRGGDFQGYRIYYEAPGDSTPGFVDTPSSVTSFLLTGLQPDTTYNVWVLAFSPAGMSQRSLMRTLTTLQVVQGPSAPAFIRASPLDGTSLVVEWEASESENVQGYIIYYQAETETSPSSVEADPSTLQSTIRGLRPDTTYTLWVVSYSPEGTSPSSPTVSAQTLQEAPGLPGSPEGLRVRAVNPKTALLTWQEPSSGADFDGYRVYYQRVEDPESVTTVNVHRSSTSYILENLQPGQKYLMWIAAYSTRGVSEVTQRVDLRMPQGSLPGAPLNVRASSTEPTSIVVQWDSPRSGGDVERYQIYYRSSEDSSVSQIPVRGDELTWTITGLQTDLDYMVWIEAVNSEGSGPRSDVINVQTPSEAPGEPQNLQVESTFLTSVTITWEAPTSGGELEGYRIYYQRVGDDGMRSPTRVIGPDERSFSLTGLEQGTDYRIYLVPFSSDRVGTSSPVLSVRTQSAPVPQPPGTPLSVRASALDSSSVRVTWRHPTRGGAAAGYKVHYQVAGEPEVVTVEVRPTDRALMLSGLRPSTSYDIWMTAFSLAGSSPRTPSVMVRTPEMAPQTPGRPRSIRAETLNPTTMYVQWQHPVRGTDLVERYRVYYQAVRAPTPSFRVARADETSITIPGMASSTTYNIWVVAVSAAGAGQPSPSITLATPDAVSEVPGSPEDIQVSLEDDSSIRVEWQPPTSGGEVLGYRINYQEAGNEDATTIEVGPYVYYQVIRRLKPDTEYYIWVVGFSSDGDGRRSQILSVTMESEGSTQLGPPADLQVSLLDDESVLLQWSAPETAAGILGYRLYYQPIGSTDVSNLEVGPDVSSHPIRGLEPGVDYVVWIVAFTQEGEGLRSAKMNVRIDRQVIGGSTYPGEGDRINIIPGVVVPNPSSGSTPDQEDRWALLGLPASPENVQVARVDSTTMRVQWMPPTSGGRVAGYRIYYQGPDDDESRSIDTPPSARTQTITGLVPGVDYNIWVLAFSLVGVGPQSDSFTVRTYPQGPVPRAPADVQMAVVNPSMVRLNWEPPTALSGPILGYRIFYNPILTNMLNVREVGPTVTEYSLMDLDPYLGYNIWVLAFTEAREGQRSLSIMLPPRAQRGSSVGGSASPREVTFTAMTPNSIKIQWEKPTDSVDVIDGYGILYRSAGEDQTQTIEVGVDESEYILTGLVPDTEYILQLLAFTASGQEYRSPQISVRTSGSSQPDLGRVGVSGSSSISSTAHMSVVPSGGGTGRVIVRGGGDSGPRLPSGGQSFVIRTDANGQRSFILPNGESASGQGVQISPDGQGVVIRTDGSSTSNGQVFLVPANGGSATGGGGQTFVINPNQGEVITSSGGSSSSGGQAFLVPVSGSSGSTRDGQTVVHRFNGRPDDALQSGQTATTPAPEEGRDQDCYQDNGEEYRGQASTTEKGSQCVKWSASDFFQYSSHEYTQGEFGIGDHNYCRNPDGDAKPWCYADAEGTYEYCAIQQCRNGG
ncbi:FN1 [Branchiostoma lanceolatum]|uniref:FN1 protein n=1 Tax=Branchiostoma lanceolatum TaxID=7740 RepID=A0A8K0AFI5_BRALA|nr:FN1 [Branchiostoma lanceolatum]